ncbi:MAG: arsenate reductase ArsC [Desulfobacterales bacterium]|nr:arsenate reductase ArsC [Desulfobacterales bacterium]
MTDKYKILFLCTGNSCRSQMAEAWTRQLKNNQFEAYSAGVSPKGIDPRAVKAMAEVGIDISGQTSKDIEAVRHLGFAYVVTLCDNANESCPFFPGKTRRIYRGFDDPPRLSADAKTEAEKLAPYRRVRDEIRKFVEKLPEILNEESKG